MSDVCRNTVKFALAWLAAVVPALACAQATENVLGQVEISGRQVPLVAPTTEGPYKSAKFVTLPDGRKLAWIGPMLLSEPYHVEGGWSELQAWPKLNFTNARKLHIKVVLATSSLTIYEGKQIRAERAGFTTAEMAEIDKGLAQLKALLEVAGDGKVQVDFNISTDQTTTLQIEKDGVLTNLDPLTTGEAMKAVMNRSPFATDDGSYWGPFACSLVIHAGAGSVQSLFHDMRPCGVVPYYRTNVSGNTIPFGSALVTSLGGRLDALVTGPLRSVVEQPETDNVLGINLHGVAETHLNDTKGLATLPSLVPWLSSKLGPGAKAVPMPGHTVFLYNPDKPATLLGQTGLPDPGELVPRTGSIGAFAFGTGDLKTDALDDAEGKRWRIQVPKGAYNRAQAGFPVETQGLAVESGASLTFRFRSKSKEPWTVHFGSDTWTLADARTGLGRAGTVARMAFDGTWETVSLPISTTAVGSTRATFSFADVQRLDQAETTAEIADLKLVSDPAKTVKPQQLPDPYADLRGKTVLSAEDVKGLVTDMTGPDTALASQAAWLCSQVKVPSSLIVTLLAQAEGADAAVVYASCKALKFQGSEEAFAALKTVLDFGPFEINRRIAMTVIGDDVTKLTLKDIQSLIVARSWMGQLAGLQALAKIEAPNKPIQIITMLQYEDPRVRAAVVEAADADNELSAKRLLYGAVNDPSELVRIRSFIKLIDTKVEAVRREAMASVRNEATTVALAVLGAMTLNPKPEYRPALLQAVVDPRPEIKAAALQALGAQAAPVALPEIQNLLSDSDTTVQHALASLAYAKKVQLPAEVLAKLKASPDYFVARVANAIGN